VLDVKALTAMEGKGWRERVADGELQIGDKYMRLRTQEEIEEGANERRDQVVIM
jgi:hypothetical protein